jgi:hypothetical protein
VRESRRKGREGLTDDLAVVSICAGVRIARNHVLSRVSLRFEERPLLAIEFEKKLWCGGGGGGVEEVEKI